MTQLAALCKSPRSDRNLRQKPAPEFELKIAVISDIHSAAEHFRDALLAARAEGFDQLVILGDLFTYGPEPVATLEIAQEAASQDGAAFITGNHDLLYMEQPERDAYVSRLPEWIRESVEWTSEQLGGIEGIAALPWKTELCVGSVLFAHANPFTFGDWTYLRDGDAVARASAALAARSFNWGVFGHVHRFRFFEGDDDGAGVVTVGSIGQPRDTAEPFSQWAMVTLEDGFTVEQRRVARDWRSTMDKIRASSVSEATKERLCQFYR